MKLILNFWQKIQEICSNYAHTITIYKTAKAYPKALLKPTSRLHLNLKKTKVFKVNCSCFLCTTVSEKTYTKRMMWNFARDGWRIHWTMPIKYAIFFQLYNFMSMNGERTVFHLKQMWREYFVVIEYESLYLFFRDILLTIKKRFLLNIITLLFNRLITKIKNNPYIQTSVNALKTIINFLRKHFNKLYKLLWTQKFIYFLYKGIKNILLSSVIAIIFFIILIIILKITTLQHYASWIIFGNIFFWLMSGFNFFIKRGKFGKFTSRLQRFWKHAFVSFWVIEGFLFSLFFYYYLNSSQEPLDMYDHTNLSNDFILNLQSGFLSTFLLSAILYTCHILALLITHRTYFQSVILLLVMSVGVFYLFFLESYQIYYVFNGFSDIVYVFDEDQNTWVMELESFKLRIKQYYFVMCVIAKFWHFIFIFFSWIFFLLKSLETQKISYNLLSFNYQNLLILFVLNMLCYCNWIHFIFRRYFDISYFWFFSNPDQKHLRLIIDEIVNLITSCLIITTQEMQFNDLFQLII